MTLLAVGTSGYSGLAILELGEADGGIVWLTANATSDVSCTADTVMSKLVAIVAT